MLFTPSAHASQVEVNKQTGAQNAAAVGTGMFSKTLTKAATRTNWKSQVLQVITIPSLKPSCKSLIKMPSKSGAVKLAGNAVFQDLDQKTNKQFGF